LWSKVADDESWADEWARVCAYVVDLFQLSEMPKVELTYVDDDGDEITMLVPPTTKITLLKQGRRSSTRCWKLLMSFAMEDTSKCRKLYVTDTRKQTVEVLPSRNYKVQHKLKGCDAFYCRLRKEVSLGLQPHPQEVPRMCLHLMVTRTVDLLAMCPE
jgi:hypothetical protein